MEMKSWVDDGQLVTDVLHVKRKLRQHEAQAGKGVEPDPEEEQYWRYEIPHTIS